MKKLFFTIFLGFLVVSSDCFAVKKKMVLVDEENSKSSERTKVEKKQENKKNKNSKKAKGRKYTYGDSKMNIKDVLLYTYNNNESLLSERANLQSVKNAKLNAIGQGFLPNLYLSYSKQKSDKEYDKNDTTIKLDNEYFSLNLSQPIFKSGRSVIAIKDANMQIKAQSSYLRQIEQDVMYEAINAYVSMVRDRKILDLSIDNEKYLEQGYEYARRRNIVGDATKTDVATAKARYFAAKSNVSTAKRNLLFSQANFKRVTGISINDVDLSAKKSDYKFEFQYDTLNVKDTIISQSIDQNPALKLARIKYEIEKNNLNSKKAEFLPTVTFDAYAKRGEDYITSFNERSDYERDSIALNVNIPLFQSATEYSNLRVAQSNVSKTKYDFSYTKSKIIEEASKSYDDFLASKDIISSRSSYVDAIGLSLKSIETEERLGLKTIIDVLDIKREYHIATISMTTAEANNILAYFKVKSVLGELNPIDLNLVNNKN